MAIATNSLVASSARKPVPFSVALQSDGIQRMMKAALGDSKAVTRFTADLTAAVGATPALKNCEPGSIVSAGLQCAALNLSASPALGEAWIIPYGDRATFQIGKNGLVQLAIRSGQYKDIGTTEVREGEYKGRDRFTGKPVFEFIEDDEARESRPVIGYLAYFEMLNGFRKSVYFSREKMLKWAQRYSQAFSIDLYKKYVVYQQTGSGITSDELRKCSSPWYENFDAQGEKTVLRQLLQKWGVKSREMVTAMESEIKQEMDTDGFFTAQEAEAPIPVEGVQAEGQPVPEAKVVGESDKPVKERARRAKPVEKAEPADDDFFN